MISFLKGRQTRAVGAGSGMATWPHELPLLELIFTLTAWFPPFQRYPEGQVYLEAVSRTVAETGRVSSYSTRLLHRSGAMTSGQFRR
jgi:DNA helicase-2/ATP-dependent DNA helicase PcrA